MSFGKLSYNKFGTFVDATSQLQDKKHTFHSGVVGSTGRNICHTLGGRGCTAETTDKRTDRQIDSTIA